MAKRSFITFVVFAVIVGVGLPIWAIAREGSPEASPEKVAESDQRAKTLFATNCGSCHTLARAGTHGVVGPDLDDLLGDQPPEANTERVLSAIEMGREGRMPAGILQGQQAQIVADFVARVAGQ